MLPEIRPERAGEVELRVGGLQQEVAGPLYAAGPDDQVGAGELAGDGRLEAAAEQRLVDVLRADQPLVAATSLRVADELLAGLH